MNVQHSPTAEASDTDDVKSKAFRRKKGTHLFTSVICFCRPWIVVLRTQDWAPN